MTRHVLIVDDDAAIRTSLVDALSADGFTVATAESATAALAMFDRAAPDVVLSDVRMPGMDGLALLDILRERAPDVDVILMTAFDDMPTVVAAMRRGAVEFLVKPLNLARLRSVVRGVFDDRRTRRSAGGSVPTSVIEGALVGRSPRMIEVYKLVGQAAGARATVLVRGESGTGKELVARAIHDHSANAKQPFVPVNCAALPNSLLESELFGHVRGAFTGAHEARRGRFALAGSGTIFLDEIGDTSPDFQSKLLRVIQDREFQAVGSEKAERTEARVIAATHQDLEQMIADRRFREDLYYRLRVVEIVIPPLRERPDDIPILAEHLAARASRSLESGEVQISREAIDALVQHSWPGNVRELENCIARASVLAAGGVIRPQHLIIASPRTPASESLGSLEQMEREHLVRVLKATSGAKSRAAEILGVSRPRLNRLLEKYGLE